MKKLSFISLLAAALCASIAPGMALHAKPAPGLAQPKGTKTVNHASGPFEVTMSPQKPDNPAAEAAGFGRMSVDKRYHGDLEATGKGEMLAVAPDAKGSGVYVALERVTGTLKGRAGSFLLHHTGIMDRGTPDLVISVAPDSGTGQLTGISGKMTITIAAGGKHSYNFDYSLPEPQ